jgi:hypothetical protein
LVALFLVEVLLGRLYGLRGHQTVQLDFWVF